MMQLFDFKFLVLLGLTLVVYFMYKEIDFQRERLLKCETQLKTLLEKNPLINDKEEILSLPLPPPPSKPLEDQNVSLKLSLPSKMVHSEPTKNPLSSTVESESDTDTISKSSESDKKLIQTKNNSKHLEIYSNDNENLTNTSISDTLIKNPLTNSKLDVETTESKSVSDTHLSNEELDEVLKDLKKELNITNEKPVEENNEEKTLEETNEEKPLEEKPLEELKYLENNLNKLKFNEIQDIAKTEEISLRKKENGKNKQKNKQELIEEIITIRK